MLPNPAHLRYPAGEPSCFTNALEYKEFADQMRARVKAILRSSAATAPAGALTLITNALAAATDYATSQPKSHDAWVTFDTSVIFLDALSQGLQEVLEELDKSPVGRGPGAALLAPAVMSLFNALTG